MGKKLTINQQRRAIDRPIFTGKESNVINPFWLNANVGAGHRFPKLLDLFSHLKSERNRGIKSFAGGPIDTEIELVETMIADADYKDQVYKIRLHRNA